MSTNSSPRLPDFQIEYYYVSNFLLEFNSREWELNKVSFSCHRHGVFVKEAADKIKQMRTIPLKSQPYTIIDRTNLSRVLSEATRDLYERVEMLNLQGSGFSMTQALSVDIQISRVLGVLEFYAE